MTWFQIWTVCWQVAVFLTPLMVGVAVLWLKSQFQTKADAVVERNRVDAAHANMKSDANVERTRVDIELSKRREESDRRWEAVRDQLADHSGRIKAVEADIAKPPSRHTLNNELSKVQAGIHSLGRSLDDIRSQMGSQDENLRRLFETQNTYMHTLIERGLGGK